MLHRKSIKPNYMIKEFFDNVQKLFDETVQDKSVQSCHTAADLLAVLHRKVTQPIQVMTDDTCARAIYYNVSVTMANDLSSMGISYNSDYQMTFHGLTSCDLHQLSEFILALERDIPRWRHIWLADDKLRKAKANIGERVRSSMLQFRNDWMSERAYDDERKIELFRIKYYNLQACKMCLDNGNPFWENKKTEAEILEECRTLHMDPPMEQWYIDFTDYVDKCKQLRNERDRKREEQKREQEKMRHLIRIKQLKLEALIKTIEFHDNFSVTVEQHFLDYNARFFSRRPLLTMDGLFIIRFKIDSASTRFSVKYKDVDLRIPAIMSVIKRVNDMVPELLTTLINEGREYHLSGDGIYLEQALGEMGRPFCIVEYSDQDECALACPNLASSRVVSRINAVIRELEQ